MDNNPTISEITTEYQIELRGGEYDGLKYHFVSMSPPYEWVLRDVRNRNGKLATTEWCYRQAGLFVMVRDGPEEEPHGVEWDSGFFDEDNKLPCEHIHTLLPLPATELREVYPEVLIWHRQEHRGVVVVHALYDLIQT